jgi:hypothetical protein
VKGKRGEVTLTEESLFFPFVSHGGVELAHVEGHSGVPAKSRKGYMTMVEFATSLLPVGFVSLAPEEGFTVLFASFFEWGFG